MKMETQELAAVENILRIKNTVETEEEDDDGATLTQFSQRSCLTSSNPKSQTTLVIVANPVKGSIGSENKRPMAENLAIDKAMLSTKERAEEIRSSLDPTFPSFVKFMLRSHVTRGFWLGLPSKFCAENLSKEDILMTLVDEDGKEYFAKYLALKCGLSGGWKGFSVAHKIEEGDAVVFQLIKINKFKVYIVRTSGLAEVDGALGLLQLEACVQISSQGNAAIRMKPTNKTVAGKRQKRPPLAVIQGNNESIIPPQSVVDQPENLSEEADSEFMEGIKFASSVTEFQDIKNLESFTIVVNDLIIDSEMSKHVKSKYYELCCSQNSFLHKNLVPGLNIKLVAGIISETVNIADAIASSRLSSTSTDEYAIWRKSLQAFEHLGMNVGFLLPQLDELVKMASESEQAVDMKRYKEAMIERILAEEEIKTLEVKLVELKDASKRFEKDVKTLRVKAEKHELEFETEANAPW